FGALRRFQAIRRLRAPAPCTHDQGFAFGTQILCLRVPTALRTCPNHAQYRHSSTKLFLFGELSAPQAPPLHEACRESTTGATSAPDIMTKTKETRGMKTWIKHSRRASRR